MNDNVDGNDDDDSVSTHFVTFTLYRVQLILMSQR